MEIAAAFWFALNLAIGTAVILALMAFFVHSWIILYNTTQDTMTELLRSVLCFLGLHRWRPFSAQETGWFCVWCLSDRGRLRFRARRCS